MKIVLMVTLFNLLFFIHGSCPLAAIIECVGPNGELFFTDDRSCPAGYTNTTPVDDEIQKSSSAKKGPLAFGLQIGMTIEDIEEALPHSNLLSLDDHEENYSKDFWNFRIGFFDIEYLSIDIVNNKLANALVMFNSSSYHSVSLRLIEKYGAPLSKKTSIEQNRMGANFKNEKLG